MRSRPDNHLLKLNYFRSTGSSVLQPQLNPTSLWAVTLVCHSGSILPTYAGVKPSTYLMKRASQTLRLLLQNLQFESVPKLLRSLGSAAPTWNYRPIYKQCINNIHLCKPAVFSLFPARLEGSQHYLQASALSDVKRQTCVALVLAAHIKQLRAPVCPVRPTN